MAVSYTHLDVYKRQALTHARTIKKRPTAIIMATVKGKGLSVAEGKLSSHNMPLSPEDVAAALQELQ